MSVPRYPFDPSSLFPSPFLTVCIKSFFIYMRLFDSGKTKKIGGDEFLALRESSILT